MRQQLYVRFENDLEQNINKFKYIFVFDWKEQKTFYQCEISFWMVHKEVDFQIDLKINNFRFQPENKEVDFQSGWFIKKLTIRFST